MPSYESHMQFYEWNENKFCSLIAQTLDVEGEVGEEVYNCRQREYRFNT